MFWEIVLLPILLIVLLVWRKCDEGTRDLDSDVEVTRELDVLSELREATQKCRESETGVGPPRVAENLVAANLPAKVNKSCHMARYRNLGTRSK